MSTKKIKVIRGTNFIMADTLQQAWEKINEGLIESGHTLVEKGTAVSYGSQLLAYNTEIIVGSGVIDPNFNFGVMFGYTPVKWSSLLKNYVDLNYLDLIKSEIDKRGKNKSQYNFAFHFSNKYGSGKDCLVSMIFCKRARKASPEVIFTSRVAEVTCRLIFDFLLIQRILEYVYGDASGITVRVKLPTVFITAERFSMYHNWKDIPELLKGIKSKTKFQQKVTDIFTKFATTDPALIKYRVHRRAVLNIQKDATGKNLSGRKDLFAKNLTI